MDSGAIDAIARDGLHLVFSGTENLFGAGMLQRYLVRSDTRGRVFAECARPHLPRDVSGTRAQRRAAVAGLGALAACETDEPVELHVAAELLAQSGHRVLARAAALPGVSVSASTSVTRLHARGPDQRPGLELTTTTGRLLADRAILAVGGQPWSPPIALAPGAVMLHSDLALQSAGVAQIRARLKGLRPRVTILGGAHSAFAVAGLLLRLPLDWAPGSITVLHRRRITVTYPDTGTARNDGVAVGTDCVCPDTGIVHRFGGLRGDSAELFRRVRDGGEPRIRLRQIGDSTPRSDDPVVVAATGYRSRASTLLPGGVWDADGRLLDRDSRVVPGVIGLGLGTGRRRTAETGGEVEFSGSVDGVWFYRMVVAPSLLSSSLVAST